MYKVLGIVASLFLAFKLAVLHQSIQDEEDWWYDM